MGAAVKKYRVMNGVSNTKKKEGYVMEKLTLSIPEAAQVLGISKSLMYRFANSGRIRVIKIGNRKLIPKKEIEKFLYENVMAAE